MRQGLRLAILAVGMLVLVGYASSALAATPDPPHSYAFDRTFSDDGVVVAGRGHAPASCGVAVQSDEKPLVCIDGDRFLAARYLTDGRLDRKYGERGLARAPANLPGSIDDFALDGSGRTIEVSASNEPDEVEVTRLDSSGHLDPSFSGDGTKTVPVEHGNASPQLAVGPGGKIWVAVNSSYARTIVYRLRPNGSVDDSFGDHGRRVVDAQGPRRELGALEDLAIDRRGRAILGESASTPEGTSTDEALVARLTPEGRLDSGFSGDGRKAIPGLREAAHVVIGPGNSIVLAGDAPRHDQSLAGLARLSSQGRLVRSFSRNGLRADREDFGHPKSNVDVEGLAVRDSRIVITGSCRRVHSRNETRSAYVARYSLGSGARDPSFARHGIARISLGYGDAYITGINFDGLGRPLLAGELDNGDQSGYFVARLKKNG